MSLIFSPRGCFSYKNERIPAQNIWTVFLFLTILFSLLPLSPLRAEENPWKGSPGKREYPQASALVLKDLVGLDVNRDGSTTSTEYLVIKLLDASAQEKYGQVLRMFVSPQQQMTVETARIYKADGSVINLDKETQIQFGNDMKEKVPLHKDVVIVKLDFSQAIPGDIIEFKIITQNKTRMLDKYFWTLSFTQDEVPLLDTQLLVNIHQKGVKPVFFALKHPPEEAQPTITPLEGGGNSYSWNFTLRPVIADEPSAPPFRDRTAIIMFSNFSSWEEFSRAYLTLLTPSLESTPKIKEKVRELTKNIKEDRDKILAIGEFISSKNRLNIDFDPDHFFFIKPDELLTADAMGNFDAQLLFINMLKSAGLKVTPLLLADANHGSVVKEIPTPHQFNKLIAGVEIQGKKYYIDGTHPLSRSLETYPAQQGRTFIPLMNKGAKLEVTPITPAEANQEKISVEALLSRDGGIGIQVRLTETGTKRQFWTSFLGMLPHPELQEKLFIQLARVISPDAQIMQFNINDDRNESILDMELTFSAKNYPLVSGKYWIVKLPLFPVPRKEGPPTGNKRKFPIRIDSTGRETKTVLLRLPDNVEVRSLPSSLNFKNSIGSVSVTCSQEGDTIKYEYIMNIDKIDVPAEEFPALMELYQTSEKAGGEVILLEKKQDSSTT